MKNARLLSTVAAALLLAGSASAQTTKDQAPERAPAAQQKAPAEKAAPPINAGERKAPDTTGQAQPAAPSQAQMPKSSDPSQGQMKTEDKSGQFGTAPKDSAADSKAKDSTAPKAGQSPAERSGATTGQGAAAGATKLSPEQRTKITTIFKQKKVEPVRLNVSIRVGTRIPDSVRYYPVPVEVVEVYPEWRGYDYILVGNDIVIVDPRTHEIVAVLEA
jgi:hypothetical protein